MLHQTDPVPLRPEPAAILINGSLAESLINFRGDFIRDLVAVGHRVHVSAPAIDIRAREAVEALGARAHSLRLQRTGLNPFADLSYLRQILAVIDLVKPHVVVNYTIKPNIWGSLAARIRGVPAYSMVTGLGIVMIPGQGAKRRLVQGLARQLYAFGLKGNRKVIFQNADDAGDCVAAGIVDPGKVAVVPGGSGVNLSRFTASALPDQPVFLMIARLLRTKGIAEYAEACRSVHSRRPDAKFLLVGMSDDGPDGMSEPASGTWADYGIQYLGPLDDVRPALAQASVYVLPSYREGTPRSVLEAMAMGRPIITTDAPGCRETVRNGENGLLVPVGDAEALAGAMHRLVCEPDLRQRMGMKSLALAQDLFDVRQVNRRLMQAMGLLA